MAEDTLPRAETARSPRERAALRRIVAERGLGGLANNTKWDEFLTAMRSREEWRPSYRWKCLDGSPSRWEVEWSYHLPFPMMSVEWFDVSHLQEVRVNRLPPRIDSVDHSSWIEAMLRRIGLDFRTGATMTRIFGYSPRSLVLFDA